VIDVREIPRGLSTSQDEINRILVENASAGRNVVRFKGGDDYVFGRGYEELEACQAAGVPVRVIPGMTSALAVPALAGIPITTRGVVHEVTVASGHVPPGQPDSLTNWDALARLHGTLVLLMAVENAGAIAHTLIDAGRDPKTAASIICDGTFPTERRLDTTLGDVATVIVAADVHPPAVIVIGAVAAAGGDQPPVVERTV
jgi:uroporphyrin-III C-methyltransferase/precorrin-2 dehydrogenase/sirohydrochlorin ferrochelatase